MNAKRHEYFPNHRLAAAMTTFAFIPQMRRSRRTRDTRGISLGMYTVFTLGIALWLIYGLRIYDLPIALANAVMPLLAFMILILKLRYR